MPLEATQKRQLDELGYILLPGLMGAELLAALRRRVEVLFIQEGDNAGGEFKKEPGCRWLANLTNPHKDIVSLAPAVRSGFMK